MLKHGEKRLFKKLSSLLTLPVLASTLAMPSNALAQESATDNYVYAGLELGLSEPIWKEFDYKDDQNRTTKIGLKDSRMIGGRLGWSFYPNMAVEISGTHQPQHGLTYILPETPSSLMPGTTVPKTHGRTKVKANVYTLNLIYKLPALEVATITPYVIGGAGVAIIDVKSTSSSMPAPAPLNMMLGKDNIDFFRVNRTKTTAPAYQLGVGFTKQFGNNFEVDLSSRFQMIQNIKINYGILSNPLTNEYTKQKPIKKTIAVGEFTLGMLFKFPV